MPFMESSARDGTNVNEVFHEIARRILADKQGSKLKKSDRHQLENVNKKPKDTGCC